MENGKLYRKLNFVRECIYIYNVGSVRLLILMCFFLQVYNWLQVIKFWYYMIDSMENDLHICSELGNVTLDGCILEALKIDYFFLTYMVVEQPTMTYRMILVVYVYFFS